MKVLFVCNQGKHRSKTAELLFAKEFTTRSRGLYNETPILQSDVTWADLVVVMEERQRKELSERFPVEYLQKKIISLDIPDVYQKDDSTLKELLMKKMRAAPIL